MRNLNLAAIVSAVLALAGGAGVGAYTNAQIKPDVITFYAPDWSCQASPDGVVHCVRLSSL